MAKHDEYSRNGLPVLNGPDCSTLYSGTDDLTPNLRVYPLAEDTRLFYALCSMPLSFPRKPTRKGSVPRSTTSSHFHHRWQYAATVFRSKLAWYYFTHSIIEINTKIIPFPYLPPKNFAQFQVSDGNYGHLACATHMQNGLALPLHSGGFAHAVHSQ